MATNRRIKEDGISRRDFLEGVLIAAGGMAVLASSPAAWAHYPPGTTFPPDGAVGVDPRVLRGGNLRDTFTPAHWLRDERLTWSSTSVSIAKSDVDSFKGTFPILTDTGSYDVIVVGGGIAGLSTAFHLRQANPNVKVLILENNPRVGGNASRDDASPVLPTHSASGGAYLVYPYDDFLFDFYDTVGVEYAQNIVAAPFYSYFFDSHMPASSRAVWNGTTKWVADAYNDQGIAQFPFSEQVLHDLHAARQDFRGWYNTNGSPTDPPDRSDPKYDHLAHQSLRDYLTVTKGFHPAVADFYDQFASDALACVGQYANAHSAISFIGAEYFPVVAFPGGLSYVARRALKHLIPASISGSSQDDITNNPINFSELDKASKGVRFRTGANVLRADTGPTGAQVTYFLGGQFHRANCKAVILAGQMHTAHRIVDHLLSPERITAAGRYQHIPVPIANVAVRNSQFLVNIGSSFNYYWYGSEFWQDCVTADYVKVMNDPARRNDGSRPNVLTFYSGFFHNPETERRSERVKLLTTPFSVYEASLREDMERVFGPFGFDWVRDVSAVYLYRWGHGMVVPYVGWIFGVPVNGPSGQVTRTDGPRAIGRQAIGRISFAAQDSEGTPAVESAIFSGKRTAEEVAAFL
jgi:spermidine dehydrogenase